jgi:hypothetical protein
LSTDGRAAAIAGTSGYVAAVGAKGRKLCDVATYLREKRWEAVAPKTTTEFAIQPGSLQAERWLAYWDGRPDAPKFPGVIGDLQVLGLLSRTTLASVFSSSSMGHSDQAH